MAVKEIVAIKDFFFDQNGLGLTVDIRTRSAYSGPIAMPYIDPDAPGQVTPIVEDFARQYAIDNLGETFSGSDSAKMLFTLDI